MNVTALRFLSSLTTFEGVPDEVLARLASGIETLDVPAGALLVREGAVADDCLIVQRGECELVVDDAAGGERVVGRVGPGDVVAPLAMQDRGRHGATVRATTEGTVWLVPRASLEAVMDDVPLVRERLEADASRQRPSHYLTTIPLFAGMDREALRDFDHETHWVRLAGGDTLFNVGEPADDLYVIVRGRLEVTLGEADADVVAHLGAGDVVGEIGVLTGAPRNATVRAVRDTDLVRLSRAGLQGHLERHPAAAMTMLSELARRVTPVRRAPADARVSTLALVATTQAPLPASRVRDFVAAFGEVGGPTLLIDAGALVEAFGGQVPSPSDASGRVRVTDWLHERESRASLVVFDCSALPAAWVSFALRQADLVMLVAPVGADANDMGEVPARIMRGDAVAASTERVLVLLHAADTAHPTGTARWLERYAVMRHHHVRVDRADDFRRVARFVARKAVGLAMSGGGARTMAHLGVMRAMRDRGLPLDMVGAVSAGVLSASYCALGHDAATVERLCRANAGNYSMLRDATLPVASFMAGREANASVLKMYGKVRIEDLWLPYFCLSANLTTASLVVHDRGPLWLANRASTAVPGILAPVALGGELLVDGGVLNNLPVDVMRARCPGIVVAADVSLVGDLRSRAADLTSRSGWAELWARVRPFGRREPALPHVFEILARTATLSSIHHGGEMARSADIYVRTPTTGVATFDWQAGFGLVDTAHALALDAIDAWRLRQEVAR